MSSTTASVVVPDAFATEAEREVHEKRMVSLRASMGATALGALQDPTVLEIMLNPDGKLWVEKFGAPMALVGRIDTYKGRRILSLVAAALNTVITREEPVVEGEFPLDGSRFEGMDAPIVAGPAFAIRKKAAKVFTLDEYVSAGVFPAHLKAFFEEAIIRRQNILVAGGTGSGKTTLTNSLIETISRLCPHDRIITMEDTRELVVMSANRVEFRTTDFVKYEKLLKTTLRLRPDRIIVGEVRDGSAHDLLKCWNTGHDGGLGTLHSNSAFETFQRLRDLVAERVVSPMHSLIGQSVDVIIFIAKTAEGRRVTEVLKVNGYDEVKRNYDTEYIFRNRKAHVQEENWWKKYTQKEKEAA
jgi:type IV secretion system protein VirB11